MNAKIQAQIAGGGESSDGPARAREGNHTISAKKTRYLGDLEKPKLRRRNATSSVEEAAIRASADVADLLVCQDQRNRELCDSITR